PAVRVRRTRLDDVLAALRADLPGVPPPPSRGRPGRGRGRRTEGGAMTQSSVSPVPVTASGGNIHPITFSGILSRLNASAEEIALTPERSAWTSILALCRAFSCALYDAVPRQVAMVDA